MTIPIFLKSLDALCPITNNGISGYTVALKQALQLLIQQNPADAQQIANMLASCVCNDASTFESAGCFIAACLTQGNAANIPLAVQRFQQMCMKVSQ